MPCPEPQKRDRQRQTERERERERGGERGLEGEKGEKEADAFYNSQFTRFLT